MPVTMVTVHATREGLGPEEQNPQLGEWRAVSPTSSATDLVLTDPGDGWEGEPLELDAGGGYIAEALAEGEVDGSPAVISQVAFYSSQLDTLTPGQVYVNDPDPDEQELQEMSPEEFREFACR